MANGGGRTPLAISLFRYSRFRSALRVGNGRQQRYLGPARIEPRVLHHDRYVRLEHRGIVGVERDWLGVFQIVEAQMKGPPRRDDDPVRTCRVPVGEIDGEGDLGLAIAGIQDACRLMRKQGAILRAAFRGNITLGNGPPLTSDFVHDRPLGMCRARRAISRAARGPDRVSNRAGTGTFVALGIPKWKG